MMIKSFKHKGVQAFFEKGSVAGIQSRHAPKLRVLLTALEHAKEPKDMAAPSWKLHQLHNKGRTELKGHFSVSVSGNWRLTFMFDDEDVVLVDYVDYH